MSSKNQSIKSFFGNSSAQNVKKPAPPPVEKSEKTEKEKEKDKEKDTVVEKVIKSPKKERKSLSPSPAKAPKSKAKSSLSSDPEKENGNKKKSTAKKSSSSPSSSPSLVLESESSSSEDSPIKRRPSIASLKDDKKKEVKRRKVVLSSSSEEEMEEEVEKKKPEKKTTPKMTSPKAASPKKTKEEKKEKEDKKLKEEKKVKEEKKTVIEVKKEQKEAPVKPEKLKVEMKLEVKEEETGGSSKLFSKSTGNFFGGKKAEKNENGTPGIMSSTASSSSTDEYLPNRANYHPIDDATWTKDQPTPYKALAQTLYCMEQTTKRLELLEIVSNYFRSLLLLSPKDLVPSLFILTNKVAPDYDTLELGIGDTVLFKALGEATGCTLGKLKVEFQQKGDIGLVAEANRCNQKQLFKPKKLTLQAVFTKFHQIASISGNASRDKKCDLIKSLLVATDAVEARYLMRSLAGKLRNGLGELSILQALGHACAITPPVRIGTEDEVIIDAFKKLRVKSPEEMKVKLGKANSQVKQAYYQCPNYEKVVQAIMSHGLDNLAEHCKLTPGVPLKPMLAYPTTGLHDVLKRFDEVEFTCEYKYDGERAQIHILDDGSIKIFSRNSENNTGKYPDVIKSLREILKIKVPQGTAKGTGMLGMPVKKRKKKDDDGKTEEESTKDKSNGEEKKEEKKYPRVTTAIVDAEVVAYDTVNKVIKPFQVLTTRKRKDVNESEITIQVCIFAFDLIYLNGESLIAEPFRKRRELLYEHFPYVESKLMFAINMVSSNLESIQQFLDDSIRDACEGLMVKTMDVDAHYEISKRSHNWLKLKKDYLEGVGDTLDLVCIGGYLGTGKRTGVYGGYLLACYNTEDEEYQTICKLGTGLKDDDLAVQFESLSKIIIDKPKAYYQISEGIEKPDVWFEPEQVWEIKCADFSISPIYTAAMGLVDPGKGISMRFPRFIRLRDDKKPEDATSSEQLAEMYNNQQQMQQVANKESSSKSKEDESDEE